MMMKYIIPAIMALTATAMAQAQERDTRSAWAKSQDMYVEPTLRIKETTIVVTPEQAQQMHLATKQVPAGSVKNNTVTREIIYPDGRVERVQGTENNAMPVAPAATPMAPEGTAPIQDLSTPQ